MVDKIVGRSESLVGVGYVLLVGVGYVLLVGVGYVLLVGVGYVLLVGVGYVLSVSWAFVYNSLYFPGRDSAVSSKSAHASILFAYLPEGTLISVKP